MQNYKTSKMEELMAHLAADFMQRESSGRSLITVTHAVVSDKFTKVMIFLSVLPIGNPTQVAEIEAEALDFAKRKRPEFREYVRTRAKMRNVPLFDFEIDYGEKNRQRIDELTGADNPNPDKALPEKK